MTTSTEAGRLIQPVLADLADVLDQIRPDQFADPTPCTDFDVAGLRTHVLAWLTFFAAAFNDPDARGERPDPTTFQAPADPLAAADLARTAAGRIAVAVDGGVTERPVVMVKATMPGESMLRMALWEYLVHGHDLARATGQDWTPSTPAVQDSLAFSPLMLTDDHRGEGKNFGPVVAVADQAPPLDRLLGFTGRDPHWKP